LAGDQKDLVKKENVVHYLNKVIPRHEVIGNATAARKAWKLDALNAGKTAKKLETFIDKEYQPLEAAIQLALKAGSVALSKDFNSKTFVCSAGQMGDVA
jgi:hypothetical protein